MPVSLPLSLSIEAINLTDAGTAVFTELPPIILSKRMNTVQEIDVSTLNGVICRLGSIPLEVTNGSITLYAAAFSSPGIYTLSITFFHDGRPWLSSLDFTVIE